MYKVFFYNRTIFLTEKPLENVTESFLFVDNKTLISKIIEFEKNLSLNEINIYSPAFVKLEQCFFGQFIYIEAAGGLVENTKGELLFIFRLGKWDLPKGKVEKGEKVEQAAVREVMEECGISGLKIRKKLSSTFHAFYKGHTRFLKQTYWFSMTYEGDEKLVPQVEEEISEAKWVSLAELSEIKNNTFLSIIDLLDNNVSGKD